MGKPRISFLTQEEMEAIHNASLQVLEKTGIKVMSERALDILKKGGAKVDYGTNHVTLPRQVVNEALKVAPKTITYGARNPKYDFMLNKQETHFCATGNPPLIIDGETGKCRYTTAKDIEQCLVVADYLKHVDIVWPFGTTIIRSFILFVQTAYAVLKYADAHLYKKARLSISKLIVMRAIASNNGVITPSEIAKWTQTERHNITTLIERMKRDGLIVTERNPGDRRFVNVSLTDKGREVLMQAMLVAREIVGQVMSSIGADDALLLEKSMRALRQNARQGLEYVAKRSQL